MIQRTYVSTLATGVFDEVWVVTDNQEIERQISDLGGNVFFSKKYHESGSDRIAEALEVVDSDLIVNVQGDEPFQDPKSLKDLVSVFDKPKVKMASLMCRIPEDEAYNPNSVKVVLDNYMNAIYFSRSPIPFNRERNADISYWKHIGIYAYTPELLKEFTTWPKGRLEQIEMLEQLRLVEKGVKIRMVETDHQAIAIDTKEDLDRARNFLKSIL